MRLTCCVKERRRSSTMRWPWFAVPALLTGTGHWNSRSCYCKSLCSSKSGLKQSVESGEDRCQKHFRENVVFFWERYKEKGGLHAAMHPARGHSNWNCILLTHGRWRLSGHGWQGKWVHVWGSWIMKSSFSKREWSCCCLIKNCSTSNDAGGWRDLQLTNNNVRLISVKRLAPKQEHAGKADAQVLVVDRKRNNVFALHCWPPSKMLLDTYGAAACRVTSKGSFWYRSSQSSSPEPVPLVLRW